MDKILELLKAGSICVPKIFFTHYKNLEINDKEFIVLMYLMNYNGGFNPKYIGSELGISFKEILELINDLCEKGFIEIEVRDIRGMKEEYISLNKLYEKLAFLVLNQEKEDSKPNNLFSIFEKEFGRTLSPIEYELINAWKENHFSEELILAALKEAVLNGVSNLRYIDKILYEWNRKGIKNVSELQKQKESKPKKDLDVFHYDWLNDDDE